MNLLAALKIRLYGLAADFRGQDLVEYALMAGVVAVTAGAVMPGVVDSITAAFSQVVAALGGVGGTGLQPGN